MMHTVVSLWEQLPIASSGLSVTLFSYTCLPGSWRQIPCPSCQYNRIHDIPAEIREKGMERKK